MSDCTCPTHSFDIAPEVAERFGVRAGHHETPNWNPACPQHGADSDWYHDPERHGRYEAAAERLTETDAEWAVRAARERAEIGWRLADHLVVTLQELKSVTDPDDTDAILTALASYEDAKRVWGRG